MEQVKVSTASHSYDVVIGQGILTEAMQTLSSQLEKADKIVVFTDEAVWEAQQAYFTANFPYAYELFVFPGGEASKTFEQYFAAQSFLLELGASRKTLAIAFGGGAVGDATGFVAATYMRGIPFIQVPTTILAHDSAVGGKTAINHPLGKNMIGAFYQPQGVIYDIACLASLPPREIRSGMAEVVKHAYLSDAAWLNELLTIKQDEMTLSRLAIDLKKGIEVKAAIVSEDETEQSVRKYLNLGHTYGHAIEAAAGYGKIAHGEAVMIGLIFTLLLSEQEGTITRQDTQAFIAYLQRNAYPLDAVFAYDFAELATYLMKDKKVAYGELQFVVLTAIGKPAVKTVTLAQCEQLDRELRALVKEEIA